MSKPEVVPPLKRYTQILAANGIETASHLYETYYRDTGSLASLLDLSVEDACALLVKTRRHVPQEDLSRVEGRKDKNTRGAY